MHTSFRHLAILCNKVNTSSTSSQLWQSFGFPVCDTIDASSMRSKLFISLQNTQICTSNSSAINLNLLTCSLELQILRRRQPQFKAEKIIILQDRDSLTALQTDKYMLKILDDTIKPSCYSTTNLLQNKIVLSKLGHLHIKLLDYDNFWIITLTKIGLVKGSKVGLPNCQILDNLVFFLEPF